MLLLAVLSRVSPAVADDAGAVQARAWIKAGAQAAKEKKWDACVAAYSAASAIEDASTTAGELGLCEERAGQFADAYSHLHRALEGAPSPPKDEPWSRYQAALARVLKRVALVYVTSNPTKARMVLDGRPIGRADGRGVPVPPGKHTLAGVLDGYEDRVESFEVRAGDLPNIHLELTPKTKAPAQLPSSKGTTSPAPSMPPRAEWYVPDWSPRGVLVPLAGVSLGVAVIGGATWFGFEIDRASMRARVGPGTCHWSASGVPAICSTLRERVEQRDVASGVTIGATVAVGLLLAASRLAYEFESTPTRPRVVPVANAGGGGLVVEAAW
jgi:hypothetical protein